MFSTPGASRTTGKTERPDLPHFCDAGPLSFQLSPTTGCGPPDHSKKKLRPAWRWLPSRRIPSVEPLARKTAARRSFSLEWSPSYAAPFEKETLSGFVTYAEVIACSPGLQCEASYPGIGPLICLTPRGLLPTETLWQQRFQRRKDKGQPKPRVARFALQPWATRNNTFGVREVSDTSIPPHINRLRLSYPQI